MWRNIFIGIAISFTVLSWWGDNAIAQEKTVVLSQLQLDMQGDIHWSRYNFTDLVIPYDGIDGWAEIKADWFLDEGRQYLAPYVSIVGSWASKDGDVPWPGVYDWQRYGELRLGIQSLPFPRENKWLKGIRLFGFAAWREYDDNHTLDLIRSERQAGVDYYYDNILGNDLFVYQLYSKAGYRHTNWSATHFDAFMAEADVNAGVGVSMGTGVLFPHFLIEAAYQPKYEDRWWENFIRGGIGLRWYPFANSKSTNKGLERLLNRFHVYGEYVRNFDWLADEAPAKVEEFDYRIGVAFSTGGFYNEL